ncbi:2-hydroxyacid dehydrogenase [Fictibacillus enclensis]|uniref:2-hydroxyacid dehydrogenase n=1 Tax=Fictibacillus enclensis TaxID=1017270 RepID=UPI0025A3062B|nr:2-hydroxyacid dehydrogenase [Fictibacillus enclensis]MDM5340444.1 2-hydroxyacid dehydrogenase [Fictibacillus enclensis]
MGSIVIYFDRVFPAFEKIIYEHLPSGFKLLFWHDLDENEREQYLPQADYLIVATEKLGEEILSRAKNAKLIQKTGIGVDNIDLEAAKKYAIPVANTPGANSSGVAELTILLILALYRKLPLLNSETKKGNWLMWELRPYSYEMEGKTHGFIGFGNIGRETAKRSKVFGTNIVYFDQYRLNPEIEEELQAEYWPLERVLSGSDIISLHLPLLTETKGLIGKKQLSMMKENAVLINVSRGGIVDEGELYQALHSNTIAGAGIDVWEKEPVGMDNPLFTLKNVIATPHIGAGTRDTLNRVLSTAFQNATRVEQGYQPNHLVLDPAKLVK